MVGRCRVSSAVRQAGGVERGHPPTKADRHFDSGSFRPQSHPVPATEDPHVVGIVSSPLSIAIRSRPTTLVFCECVPLGFALKPAN